MQTTSELFKSKYHLNVDGSDRTSELLSQFYEIFTEEEFTFRIKQVIPYIQQVNESKIPQSTLEKFNQVIKRDYDHYLYFCNLLRNEQINIIQTISDSNYKKIKFHGIIDSKQPECDVYDERVIIHPPLIRKSSLMIPRRYFKKENLDLGLMSSQTELLYYIANSRTNTALSCIRDGDYINDYSMEFGYNPLLLAICKGWNHVDSKKQCFTQKPIIKALLAKKTLDINCIHLKNGMTPLHIACLRGDSPELIKLLLDHGADCHALDYQGRKPVDMLGLSEEEMHAIISELTGSLDYSFKVFKRYDYIANKLDMATVPSSQERKQYILDIRYCLAKSAIQKIF